MIVQNGQINTTALLVPDLYVQIIPPQVSLLNGVPTNVLGIVGTATWGPVNAPTTISNMTDYGRLFGSIEARKYDAGTQVAAAVLQGANNMRVVRVTDGTDTAANVIAQTDCITYTSKYTGTGGNNCTVTLASGTAANSFKATVTQPGFLPEVFDNVTGSGNAFWVNLANAINNGNSALRGPSQLITAAAGAGVTAPALGALNLAGGTDGAATITGTVLVGSDATPRKGIYALRGTGASVAFLTDADDSATYANQVAYGLSEGTYLIGVTPAGDTIANAVSTKSTAGIDSYAFKLLLGDWIYWNDTVNGQVRLVSPQGFVGGQLANLAPQESGLNKQLYGIVATQKTAANLTYSSAELQQLGQAGIDVVTNPAPGGAYFAPRFGHNTSSNPLTNNDAYTRMTNYIASTINAGLGKWVGKLQTPDQRREAKASLDGLFSNMQGAGMIGAPDGSTPFQVVLDSSNNPNNRAALGYEVADVKVVYQSIIEKFLVNLQGGAGVQITRTSTAAFA